ncbi:MAG: sugar nucleotide-binding protein [Patescibacteria group bacterium]|nr:sugar nucleotide-binding protein [Patescibacteria group bacterium]
MTSKKIFITGKGQLGSFFQEYFIKKGAEVFVFGSELDVRDENMLREKVEEINPDLLIHTAAKTNIDWCEQNKLECFAINTLGADNVAKICAEKDIYLVHISSGCVLESKSAEDAQTEEVKPSPLCYYSWTKVWAEEMILHRASKQGLKTLILRPRQLLSAKVSPRNALTKMLTYDKFIDMPNSCTVIEDLMFAVDELIKKDATGVFNVANPGVTTPYEIALALKEIIKPEMEFKKISKEELNRMTLAERVDAVLDTTKLKKEGIILKEIHERMREVMRDLKKNLEGDAAKTVLEKTKKETEEKLGLKSLS